METKYLSDGRKVVICGKINQTEYIVQEVFVTKDGSEIPSGENFTAKSLHDTPVESWKQKEEKRIEDSLNKRKAELEKIDHEIKQLRKKREAAAEWVKRNNFIQDKLADFDWDHFADVFTGNIKYAVRIGWSLEVVDFESACEDYDRYNFDGIKAISLVNKYNVNTNYREYRFEVNNYKDGSGGNTEFKFFNSLEDLQKFLKDKTQELFSEGKLSLDTVKKILPYFEIDKDIYKALVEAHNDQVQKNYEYSLANANKILENKII